MISRSQLSSSATICLIVSAGSSPSVRSAGFVASVPTNTIVGSPWICGQQYGSMTAPAIRSRLESRLAEEVARG